MLSELERLLNIDKKYQLLTSRYRMLTSELDKSVVETVERVSDENLRLRALLRKAHDEFAKTDHWYHSDIKDELAKELGL